MRRYLFIARERDRAAINCVIALTRLYQDLKVVKIPSKTENLREDGGQRNNTHFAQEMYHKLMIHGCQFLSSFDVGISSGPLSLPSRSSSSAAAPTYPCTLRHLSQADSCGRGYSCSGVAAVAVVMLLIVQLGELWLVWLTVEPTLSSD